MSPAKRHSPEGYFRDSYNYEALCGLLLEPLRGATGTPCAVYDVHEVGATVLVVARDVEGLAGWVRLDYNDARLVQHWATVRHLQTHPRARGRGIATALIAELVRVARHDSLRQLHLAVRGGTSLEDFYERLGWQVVGRWPDALRFGEGDLRDEVLMVLPLGSARK